MKRNHSSRQMLIRVALATCAAAWCAAIVAPPLMHAAGHHASAIILRALFAPLCHQIATRSFLIGGEPLSVCARCTGIYAGFLVCSLGLLAAALVNGDRDRAARRAPGGWLLPLGALPSVLELIAEMSGVQSAGAAWRALAGSMFGVVSVMYVLPAIEELPAELLGEIRRMRRFVRRPHAGTR